VSITFPKVATNDSVVIIKGDKSNAEEAKRKIEGMVKDLVCFCVYWSICENLKDNRTKMLKNSF